jgi:ribosomal protein L3 glutamine methyltransferase
MFETVSDALVWAEKAFVDRGLYFGHGTDNAWDEAVALLIYVLDLPADIDDSVLSRSLTSTESLQLKNLFDARLERRIPAAYLTHQAWFCGLPFYVDERVIIPRSPIAELIETRFSPWVATENVHNILDLCCGSACIAIACAGAFPEAAITASDISQEVLQVARKNVEYYEVSEQVTLLASDLFNEIPLQTFDIIISNPPYVDKHDMDTLPEEFRYEPVLALAAGDDGLDIVRRILKEAKKFLSTTGILIVEVGNSEEALINAYPQLPFIWLEFERGGSGVFLLTAKDLQDVSL